MTSCGSFSTISWMFDESPTESYTSNRYSLPPATGVKVRTLQLPERFQTLGLREAHHSSFTYIDIHLLFKMAVKFYVWNSYIEYLDQVYFFFVVLIIIKRQKPLWDGLVFGIPPWPGWLPGGGCPIINPPFFHCYWEDGQLKVNMIINNKNCQQKTCLNPKVWDSVSPLQY